MSRQFFTAVACGNPLWVPFSSVLWNHSEKFWRFVKFFRFRHFFATRKSFGMIVFAEVSIAALTSQRINLSPFTKGCREWGVSMRISDFFSGPLGPPVPILCNLRSDARTERIFCPKTCTILDCPFLTTAILNFGYFLSRLFWWCKRSRQILGQKNTHVCLWFDTFFGWLPSFWVSPHLYKFWKISWCESPTCWCPCGRGNSVVDDA